MAFLHLRLLQFIIAIALSLNLGQCSVNEPEYKVSQLPDSQETFDSCYFPNGMASYCVPRNRCKQLDSLFNNITLVENYETVASFLNESFVCTNKSSFQRNEVCCPVENINSPDIEIGQNNSNRVSNTTDHLCISQEDVAGTCILYFLCDPFFQLISNLTRPLSKELPNLIKNSLICGRENVGGFDLPKVCCDSRFVSISNDSISTGVTISSTYLSSTQPATFEPSSDISSTKPTLHKDNTTTSKEIINSTHSLTSRTITDNYTTLDGANKSITTFKVTINSTESSSSSIQTESYTAISSTSFKPLTDLERFEHHPNRKYVTSLDECPQKTWTRIVGGSEAPIGKYPWLALLGYSGYTGRDKWKCGGSLIGDRYVLTAAHCVVWGFGCQNCTHSLITVRLGEHEIKNEFSPEKDCNDNYFYETCNKIYQDLEVEDVIINPKYRPRPVEINDIALIRLKTKVKRHEFVKPICLPYEDDLDEDYRSSKIMKSHKFWVAGWGATTKQGTKTADKLQHISLDIFDSEACSKKYELVGQLNRTTQLCVGGEEGKDSCVGDSGSSMMTNRDCREAKGCFTWKLIGIVSFGPGGCGLKGVPGVYTKVRPYIDWILNNVKE